jgi:hypothetical protein
VELPAPVSSRTSQLELPPIIVLIVPVEKYSPQRKAEFLLSTATNASDYRRARREVKRLDLDPDAIPHRRPK